MGVLLETYTPVVNWYIARFRGYQPSAEDLADYRQGFYRSILDYGSIARVDRAHGLFRNWLRAALRHYLLNRRAAEKAAKVPKRPVPMDAIDDCRDLAKTSIAEAPSRDRTWDRNFARNVIRRAVEALAKDPLALEHPARFEVFKDRVSEDESESPTYVTLAAELGDSAGALKTHMSRLRSRLGELIREEVRHLVVNPRDVDAEIRTLIEAVSDDP
jgi:DNA-directed RNA polymerase specialized sigma24 family protein